MAKLYLMMGIPGSGKSTWIKDHLLPCQTHVSRDKIRFALVDEGEEYFSRETEVFNSFVEQINTFLSNGCDVYADATHISRASRNKLLSRINSHPEEVNLIWINGGLTTALLQNENRKDTRSYVPKSVIRRMHNQIEAPDFEEGFNIIYEVNPQTGTITERRQF
jgi:predicted kinase